MFFGSFSSSSHFYLLSHLEIDEIYILYRKLNLANQKIHTLKRDKQNQKKNDKEKSNESIDLVHFQAAARKTNYFHFQNQSE